MGHSAAASGNVAPNAYRLLWAGFLAIFAAGVGFSVRGGILGDWAKLYGFTMAELGGITGGGLTGFGIIILISSVLADRIGYGKLMALAFIMHVLSAVMQLSTGYVYAAAGAGEAGRNAAYWVLFVAMFMFAIANGLCEAVVNPMVATLFPQQKTHYLNILHAGWPGGLIFGGLVSYLMNGGEIGTWAPFGKVDWVIQMSVFLLPTIAYGALLFGQRLPKSEAAESGVALGTMLAEFASIVLLFLLALHALVGYVELGTDSWISKITGSIMGDDKRGLLLFVYTSGLMFALRFFAGPIVHRISPLGLLFVSGILGCAGLTLLSSAEGVMMCVIAATVYAAGKTFLWPTMLGVVSERFPKGGAIAIGAMGGIGMLSAGLLGGPGIGFKQDYYASADLKEKSPESYDRYKAGKENAFLGVFSVQGLDGAKVGLLDLGAKAGDAGADEELKKTLEREKELASWWDGAKSHVATDKGPIGAAALVGGRQALKLTAVVPAIMAIGYLLLIFYFKAKGGYQAEVLVGHAAEDKKFTGGTTGAGEG